MYKAIIVDDEYLIRESLKKTIDWSEMGVCLEGEASNGRDALQLIQEVHPDIVLTDIRMPIMNGIELAIQIKKMHENIRIIFISGYDDFSYAQQALKIGVEDYVLKPIDNKKVLECILKVVTSIEEELQIFMEVQTMKLKLKEHQPIVLNRLLRDLINGVRAIGNNNILKILSTYDVKFDNNSNYILIILNIDKYSNFVQNQKEEEVQISKLCILNISQETLSNYKHTVVFESDENRICAILDIDELKNDDDKELYKNACISYAAKIRDRVKKDLGFTISIFISEILEGVEVLQDGYLKISKTLKEKFSVVEDFVFHADDLNTSKDKYIDIINKVKAYIAENIATDIALADVAEFVDLSPNYFCNIFKQKTGQNLMDYILEEKMKIAKAYLLSTNLKIYEVGEKVGYSDSKYFCTVFRKFFNKAPTDFKKVFK